MRASMLLLNDEFGKWSRELRSVRAKRIDGDGVVWEWWMRNDHYSLS
jgi:hypothetical protein